MRPVSTYRLQLRAEFGFAAAADVVPYLDDLGISHVYCSPVLQAVSGSVHGYDVVDHSILSEDLGGDEGWMRLVQACRDHGLGLIVDVVPNHMAMPTPESLNPALWAALAGGPDSPTAVWLDVDWAAENGRIMLPVLGDPLPDVIAAGDITVDAAAGVVRYFDHEFPLAPGTAGDPADVAAVLDQQHYRLAFWREANTSLNYRRFFDVTTLLGVRVELPDVFRATHARLLRLLADGEVDGLRIDHPDGLADPGGYLDQLAAATGGVWTVVEKILEPGEALPSSWQCAGTTGYDALGAITNVFVDPTGGPMLSRLWGGVAGHDLADWEHVVDTSKRLVVEQTFPAEIRRLAGEAQAALVAAGLPAPNDADLLAAIGELLVAFDVYRAYPESLERLRAAADRAAAARPGLASLIDQLRELAATGLSGGGDGEQVRAFSTRLAQTAGPVMAKGVEDTALYRFHRLIALNEVGGDPGHVGRPVEDFHSFCRDLQRHWPGSMTTLSTHDTKRSEDVRARLLTLAEIPGDWAAAVADWNSASSPEASAGWPSLDDPTRYLIWQTLVGAWPLPVDRLLGYLDKATREAKLATSWTDPDPSYDEAVQGFARRVYDSGLADRIAQWTGEHVVLPGRIVSLGQKLVQLTMPGVPDVYQGCELTDLSLVDPDNRRPVDFTERSKSLQSLGSEGVELPPLADDNAGLTKLLVVHRAMQLRRDRPGVFADGVYQPLPVGGPAADHAVAFRRGDDVVVVATRLPAGLRHRGGWGETELKLPQGPWHDVVTGRPVPSKRLTDLLDRLPVALLARG
jgi:(1->4)-alpha-D-glucan 1-alpha-D-glucosylmutase